jgi:hypothetical protein
MVIQGMQRLTHLMGPRLAGRGRCTSGWRE